MKGFFVTGTDTDIGKTVVTASLAAWYRGRGHRVGVLKPVQTGSSLSDRGECCDDAEFLRRNSGCGEPDNLTNPYRFRLPASPHLAARLEEVEIDPSVIGDAFNALASRYRPVLVEGAGGLLVPYTEDYLTIDLVQELNVPLLIVARPGLGTINHTLLTVETALNRGLKLLGIVFNRSKSGKPGDEDMVIEEDNKRIIEKLSGVKVWGTIPYDREICGGSWETLARKTSPIWDAHLLQKDNRN
ncbi:MAG: dethiobiotin synthase [bacterium]